MRSWEKMFETDDIVVELDDQNENIRVSLFKDHHYQMHVIINEDFFNKWERYQDSKITGAEPVSADAEKEFPEVPYQQEISQLNQNLYEAQNKIEILKDTIVNMASSFFRRD